MIQNKLVILTGPTAVGKTKLSISLAKTIGGEIISADSMQVYRHMDIGTAKITGPYCLKPYPYISTSDCRFLWWNYQTLMSIKYHLHIHR